LLKLRILLRAHEYADIYSIIWRSNGVLTIFAISGKQTFVANKVKWAYVEVVYKVF
jgi:hypothetical protein